MSDKSSSPGRGPTPQKFPHEPERIRRSAELIVAMFRKEIEIGGEEGLPDDIRPRNAEEAQQVSDLVQETLGYPVLGYKYYVNARIQEAPILTPIYNIWESPAVLSEEISQHRWIEPEMSFRCLRDFPARDEPYGYQEIADGMEAIPTFEIIGPRFRFDSHMHMRTLVNQRRSNPRYEGVADNHASGGYVIGKPIRDWQKIDWLKLRVTMDEGDKRVVDTVGGNPLVDPFISMFPLVNTMRSRGGLRAGQLLATHSYSGFQSVAPNARVLSTFTGFEPIEAIFKT